MNQVYQYMPSVIRFSKRMRLTLLLLTTLAKAKGAVSLKSIACKADISEAYLEEVAAKLRKAGLIRATRGKGGGYRLRRPHAAISLLEAIEAVEGVFELMPCVHGRSRCFTHCEGHCTTKALVHEAQRTLVRSFAEISLAHLPIIAEQRRTPAFDAGTQRRNTQNPNRI